jgi:hypothetical protein
MARSNVPRSIICAIARKNDSRATSARSARRAGRATRDASSGIARDTTIIKSIVSSTIRQRRERAIATDRDDCDDRDRPHHRSTGRARGDKQYAETATLQSTLYFGRWSQERAPRLDARVASDQRDEPIDRTRRRGRDELAPLRTRKTSDAETARNNQFDFGGVGLQGERRSQLHDNNLDTMTTTTMIATIAIVATVAAITDA